ncbi:MAG TPA: amidase, partial [Kofleriaceae bacterium]|nr:amidase [Kofleriaceae bacterium]
MSEPRPPGIADYARAYREGQTSPAAAAEACLAAIRASDQDDPPLRAVITILDDAMTAAEAASERIAAGTPRSLLDGVPIVVKDNVDVAGVPTTHGLPIELPVPEADARAVARLREAGAIIVGKANLHQLGAGTTGINPHTGTPRNPFDPQRWCGGSSSGCACAVGSGLVPMAVGTDAGGSVRAPAAFVGAVGFKPTFGRISRTGMAVLCDTLDHIGPLVTTCADAALTFATMAAIDSDDDETWDQPPLPADFLAAAARSPAGLRIGFARHTLESRVVEPEVAKAVTDAASALAEAGCQIVDVTVPDLDEARILGLILLGA